MVETEIRNVFRRAYNGAPNFLTPDVVRYGKRGKMVWELSTGLGIDRNRIYGVTVIELPSTKRHDLSTSFDSLDAALTYIKGDFTHAS